MEQDRKPINKPMHLILTKEARIYHGGKDSLFNKWHWENWTATCKRMKLEHFLIPYSKRNSKLIKYLNVKPWKKDERWSSPLAGAGEQLVLNLYFKQTIGPCGTALKWYHRACSLLVSKVSFPHFPTQQSLISFHFQRSSVHILKLHIFFPYFILFFKIGAYFSPNNISWKLFPTAA